jgi:hypothetical protein
MGEVVPADHVHGRGMHPGEPGHLHDAPAGAGDAVDHSVPGGHPAARERLDAGHEGPEPGEAGVVRIPPLVRQIIVQGPWCVRERLLQLVAEDGFADRLFQARVRGGRAERSGTAGLGPEFRRLVPHSLGSGIVGACHRQGSS